MSQASKKISLADAQYLRTQTSHWNILNKKAAILCSMHYGIIGKCLFHVYFTHRKA